MTQSQCIRRIGWMIEKGYVKRFDNWKYKYMLTDKGMELTD